MHHSEGYRATANHSSPWCRYIKNHHAKKRGISTACGHGCRRLQRRCVAPPIRQWSSALLKKHSLIRAYQCHPAPHHCKDREAGEWTDVCGFLKPPGSETEWQVRMHGAFTIPYGTSGLKREGPKLPSGSFGPSLMNPCHGTIFLNSYT